MIKLSEAQKHILTLAAEPTGVKWYAHFHVGTLSSLLRQNLLQIKGKKLYATHVGKVILKEIILQDYESWKEALHNTSEIRKTYKAYNKLAI